MFVLASFNYYPSVVALVVGGILALAVLWALTRSGSVLKGLVGGSVGWGAIAWVVFGAGSGDLTDLLSMVYGGLFAIIGAVAGGIAAAVGKNNKHNSR